MSTDNPYSELWFKTLKFEPVFPERFGSMADARAFMADFVEGYALGVRDLDRARCRLIAQRTVVA